MPKNNQKKSNKTSKIKRGIRAVARAGVAYLDGDHEAVLTSLTDPFSPEATSARYPDNGAGKSLTQTSKMAHVLASHAGFGAGAIFDANFSFPLTPSASNASTTITWAAAKVGDYSTSLLNTYGKVARPTSVGLRIANTLSATDSSGYLVIAKGANSNVSSTTTYEPNNFTSYEVFPFTHGGEWHITLNPRSPDAYDLVAPSTYNAATTPSTNAWEVVFIGIFGTKASANVAFIEATSNFEFIPVEDAVIASLAQPQPVLNIQMQTAVNAVQSGHTGIHSGNPTSHKNKLKKLAKSALVKHVLPFALKKAKQAIL